MHLESTVTGLTTRVLGFEVHGNHINRYQRRSLSSGKNCSLLLLRLLHGITLVKEADSLLCDNQAIIHAWRNYRSCKNSKIMKLLRHLYFTAARNSFTVSLSHLPGSRNRNNEMPPHIGRKASHHSKSARASELSLMW